MAYTVVLNKASSLDLGTRVEVNREFNFLRAELNDLRTKYAALLAKLDADAGVTDTNYAALGALTAAQFTPT